ncbi:MAG: ABC transporter permease, partial [Anaerolineae bacterium]
DADERVQIREFDDEEAARQALEGGQIQAFFIFPSDYPASLVTDIYYLESPPDNDAWRDLDDFVRLNLTSDLDTEVQARLLAGAQVRIHDVTSGRTFAENEVINIILPFVATFFFFFATMSSAGYMLGVVGNEKENRTMEVMVTSVTPSQLIAGKTVGLLGASLTQLAIYIVAAVIGILLAAPSVPELQQATVPWSYLGLMALFFLPAYTLISGVMVSIGSAVTELQQGQQVAGLLNLLFVAPFFVLPLIITNPSHPLVIGFTLFPTTSFLTISLRWGMGTVPLWQLGLSWVLLVTTALLSVWAAARIFRVGMLRYGQPLSLKHMMAAVRGTFG